MFLALNDIWDLLPSYNPVGEATLGSHPIGLAGGGFNKPSD